MFLSNSTRVTSVVLVVTLTCSAFSAAPALADGAYDSGGHGGNVHACKGGRYQANEGDAWTDLPGGWTCYNGVMSPANSIACKTKAAKVMTKGAVKPAEGKAKKCCSDGLDRIMETVD
ncbi:MAG: hypothetical protein N4A61_06410 [Pelagimonas sp.]|jgi:hypothetical protein|nr:hypothetical protein [Pelagimonas sp.]